MKVAPDRDTGDGHSEPDLLALSVYPAVPLLLACNWPDDGQGAGAGTYTVLGPQPNLESLQLLLGGKSAADELSGVLSPPSAVTVPVEHRAAAAIPVAATAYCWIHPLDHLAAKLETLKLARNPWAFVLLTGGFAYFDAEMKLLAINAVAMAPSPTGLVLVGRPVCGQGSAQAADVLSKKGRLVPIAYPDLLSVGFDASAWVHGSENFNGVSLSDDTPYPHGAFVYRWRPPEGSTSRAAARAGSDGGDNIMGVVDLDADPPHSSPTPDDGDGRLYLYALEPVTPEQYQMIIGGGDAAMPEAGGLSSRISQALSQQQEQYMKMTDAASAPPRLSDAMGQLRKRATTAQDAMKSVAKIASIQAQEKAGAPIGVVIWRQTWRVVVIALYLLLGVVFYGSAEEWTYIEALYFSVTTISTVGYGDYSPGSPGSRAFTGIYMLLGVALVFGLAGETYEAVTAWFEKILSQVWRRAFGIGTFFIPGHERSKSQLQPAWQHYVNDLLPTITIGSGFTLGLSAYIFTRTQSDLPYSEALWHCWVTCTTVGYGDVSLTTEASMVWASVHILLSVSWLASVLSRIRSSIQQRQWDLQRREALNAQLSEDLFDALETPAAQAEGRGVNQVEFVTGLLITMGAEVCGEKIDFEAHIKPLIDRFEVLDSDSSGYLTPGDIAFMVKQCAKQDQEMNPKGSKVKDKRG